ncbi:hypothetical protein J2X31_001000 [Flavobacterium arsenatis]|uniref:asparagine synthase (glutamine-hydrolyzing) n=1 Tax=Flavobacterium arsenatis TaxID=1484332 RepID=A0ABU1TM10_9FLAO|nr:hypothetical protein [Flavobacterium arsenatis]MDR6967000.1 hypothetical protein [Flavobacterium arsenatis]
MSYLISNIPLENYQYQFDDFYIKFSGDYRILISEDELILVEGFVYDTLKNEEVADETLKQIIKKYNNENIVFEDHITGQFNIVCIKNNVINLITDFVGMKPLYYCIEDSNKIISNNIYSFLDLNFEFDKTALIQSLVSILYIPLNKRTFFKKVNLLRSGEYISFNIKTNELNYIIDSIDIENKKINKEECQSIISLLKNNATIYQRVFKEILLPVSGGVDSRITLSSFEALNKENVKTLSYGEKDYIDNKIAREITAYLNLNHIDVSFKDSLFPTNKEFNLQVKNGGEYFINSWFSVLNCLDSTNYISKADSVILIGDVLDILRAKNIKSIRSRKKRILFQSKNIFGLKMNEVKLDKPSFKGMIIDNYLSKLSILFSEYPQLKEELSFDEKIFSEELESDVEAFLDYVILKTKPKNQLNLEEVFYIFTWGARTMAKQINLFKGNYNAFVLMSNRHLVKKILNYNPLDRFEDKLTHKLLGNSNFNKVSHFPTSQVPFIGYNSNIYIKYIIWAFRSSLDQILIKSGRKRLVKHIEWKDYYCRESNNQLLENFLKDVKHRELPINLFNKRANGELWPLSEVDINTFSFILKLIDLKKR